MLAKTEPGVKTVHLRLPSMHPAQLAFYSRPERFVVGCCGSKFGKALELGTPIITPSGWRTVGDIEIGDYVLSEDGEPTLVTNTTPVDTTEQCFSFVFSNGDRIVSGASHLWKVDGGEIMTSYRIWDGFGFERLHSIKMGTSAISDDTVKIVMVSKVRSVPIKCISVAHPSKMFLAGDSKIPTHNSFGGAIKLVCEAWNNPGWILWWVAPVYNQTRIGLDEMLKYLPTSRYQFYKQDMILELKKANGSPHSRIEFKSAQDPDKLRGFKVNMALLDEADRMLEESFVSVYTTLAPVRGRAYIISTPKTRSGFFYQEWMKGQKESPTYDPRYFSMTMPTRANPFIDSDIIEQARKNLPEDVFRTEYEAAWPDSGEGLVFRNIKACVQGNLEEPVPGEDYIMGVDLAKHNDFTVLVVMKRSNRHVVHFQRTNSVDWNSIKHIVVQTATRYNKAFTIIDSTSGSVGDVIYDNLRESCPFPLEGYKIQSNQAKKQLIEGLRLGIQECKITFPAITELMYELQIFEYNVMDSGTITYSAPRNEHDDCVLALALAYHAISREVFRYSFQKIRI